MSEQTVADRHYLEEELDNLFRTEPEMFRFLQKGSLDGIWYWDLEQPENEWMSPEFWELFGIEPGTRKHLASEWQDMIFAEDLQMAIGNFEKHCADPAHPYDQIVRYRHADGSTVWVRCRGIAIRNEEGKPIRLLGAHNDLTPYMRSLAQYRSQRRATRREMERADEAVAANEDLRAFAYAASHDMRAPANTLRQLFVELDRSLVDSDVAQARELVSLGMGTVDRMSELVKSLLDFTQMLRAEEPTADVDLNVTAEEVLSDLKQEIGEAGASVDVGSLPTLRGSPAQFRSLLQNLIQNAVRYRREGIPCTVRLTSSIDGTQARLMVSDNGIGIEDRFRSRIFEPFKRLHAQDDIPGTGLGLTLCQRIIASYGGTILVDSRPGEGSTFTVELPLRDGS